MIRKNWKKITPRSQSHAMELCLEYAKFKKNKSVENIADMMGLSSHWNIYKWMQNGRMPTILIRPFEHACGINYLTRHIAASAGYTLIKIPTGKKANKDDLLDLQSTFNEAVVGLLEFYKTCENGDEVIGSLDHILRQIATHQLNVTKCLQPELEL